ncbi:MAG: isoprenyl transferase [Planctomycetes bacterium]|nr:isoprenyl transferase [Planctomycetota bacterium]
MKSFKEKVEKTAERLGVAPEQIPRHIAIIMDGNGRWAQKKGLPRAQGHQQGGKRVETIALRCVDFGVESLTLYSFSIENWERPKAEINTLMHLYSQYLVGIRPMMKKNNVKLIHLGRMAQLPATVKKDLISTMKITAGNTGMTLALALNYGGRAELADATKTIAQQYKKGKLRLKDINEECISRHLYTAGLADPDLLIRTANEMRISNFLLWQISYSEFYVTKTFWPDFKKSDLEKAILAYAKRKRRFGGIKSVPCGS